MEFQHCICKRNKLGQVCEFFPNNQIKQTHVEDKTIAFEPQVTSTPRHKPIKEIDRYHQNDANGEPYDHIESLQKPIEYKPDLKRNIKPDFQPEFKTDPQSEFDKQGFKGEKANCKNPDCCCLCNETQETLPKQSKNVTQQNSREAPSNFNHTVQLRDNRTQYDPNLTNRQMCKFDPDYSNLFEKEFKQQTFANDEQSSNVCCICKKNLEISKTRTQKKFNTGCTSGCTSGFTSTSTKDKSQKNKTNRTVLEEQVDSNEISPCCLSDKERKAKKKSEKSIKSEEFKEKSVKKKTNLNIEKMCGGEKNKKECSCDKNKPQPVHKRLKGDKCVLEFAVLERHAKKCPRKKPRPKSKDNRVGPFDVVGRVVYPGCVAKCSDRNGTQSPRPEYSDDDDDDNVMLGDSRRFTNQMPYEPYQFPQQQDRLMHTFNVKGFTRNSPNAMSFKCLDCGMEGPLCANPTCEWSTMVHKPRCPNIDEESKTVCDKCAARVKTIYELNEEHANEYRSPHISTLVAMANREKQFLHEDKLERQRHKHKKIARLQTLIKDTESAVKVSKSNKSFPKIDDDRRQFSDQSISSLNQ